VQLVANESLLIGLEMKLLALVRESANLTLMIGLVIYGMTLFADYQSRGRWAKNVTSLLASLGILSLALALAFTPGNIAILTRIARTKASTVLLGMSCFLLQLSIGAFGLIAYSKPFRLRHEKKINRELNRDLPKIP